MGKNQDPGSVINIPDPQHWSHTLEDPESPLLRDPAATETGPELCITLRSLSQFGE